MDLGLLKHVLHTVAGAALEGALVDTAGEYEVGAEDEGRCHRLRHAEPTRGTDTDRCRGREAGRGQIPPVDQVGQEYHQLALVGVAARIRLGAQVVGEGDTFGESGFFGGDGPLGQ